MPNAIRLLALVAAFAAAQSASAEHHRRSSAPVALDGLWTNMSATPLERPGQFAGPTTTPALAKAYERSSVEAFNGDTSDGVGGRQSEEWEVGGSMVRLGGRIRTSLITDPADGKLPWRPGGPAEVAALEQARKVNLDGPEVRPPTERCMAGGSSASSPPMLPHYNNSLYQIVQTRDAVAIWTESGGSVRIIHLHDGTHRAGATPAWSGDSIGHWEGRTLVVDTTGFKPGETWRNPRSLLISPQARVTERFTRLSTGEIRYAFTVDDPAWYTRRWSGETLLRASAERIYEYACHEGNYAMAGMLGGARATERGTR